MKMRIASKTIKAKYKNIIVVPNCALKALDYLDADYYNCGKYGWNYDAYIVSTDTIIVAGYRPIGNIKPTVTQVDNCNKLCKVREQQYKEHLNFVRFQSYLKEALTDFTKEVLRTDCPF